MRAAAAEATLEDQLAEAAVERVVLEQEATVESSEEPSLGTARPEAVMEPAEAEAEKSFQAATEVPVTFP